MKKKSAASKFFASKTFTLIILFIVMYVVFAFITKGSMLKPVNIRSMLNSIVIVGLLAIGESFLMISGSIDLSAGNVGTASAILLAYFLMDYHFPWYVALLIALAFGALTGTLNATLVFKFNFQPFIATLAMSDIAKGLGYIFCFDSTGQASINIDNPVFNYIGKAKLLGGAVPVSLFICLALLIIYGIILKMTKFGRSVYLIGGNRQASLLAGLNPTRISYICFINGGILFSLAGVLAMCRTKTATVTGIASQQFSGITAAVLGGIAFGGGAGGMFGCFVGLLVLNCFNTGMDLVGVNTYWQMVFSGVLLLIALGFDIINSKRTANKLFKESQQSFAADKANS